MSNDQKPQCSPKSLAWPLALMLTVGLQGIECPLSCLVQLRNGTAYDGMADAQFWRAEWIGKAWDTFFEPAGLGPIMEKTRCSVTAEFFVTRERIRRHPREFYLKALAYLQTAEKKWGFNDYSIGAVFENLWHYIFGEPAFMEEMPLEECELYDCT